QEAVTHAEQREQHGERHGPYPPGPAPRRRGGSEIRSADFGGVRSRYRGPRPRYRRHPLAASRHSQMVPALMAASIHGMTSSSMVSSGVVASKPRIFLAFSVSGTRRWTS